MEPTNVKFTNLCQELEWKDYHELFSEFGKITRLYIEPSGHFGAVYFLNPEDAHKAKKALDGKPPYQLAIELVTKTKPDPSQSVVSSKISPSNKTFNMHRRSYGRYNDNFNSDVDVVQSNVEYVDVFGRILDTLVSENGEEVYVPIGDLKKSGFQIFLRGTLPRPGEVPAFDDQLLKQHEMYLRAKSKEFMQATCQAHSKEQLNSIIEKLQDECLSYAAPNIASPSFTSQQQNRNSSRGRTYEKRNFDGQERRSQGSYTTNTNNYRNDNNSRASTFNNSNNYQPRQSYNDTKTFGSPSGGRNKGQYNNSKNGYNRTPMQGEKLVNISKQSLPEKFDRSPPQKEKDGGNAPKSLLTLQIPKTTLAENDETIKKNSNSAPSINKPCLRKPHTSEETIKNEVKSSPPNENVDSKMTMPPRGVVIESEAEAGFFECIEIINEDTFIGFVAPQNHGEDLGFLDNIIKDCKLDPTFIPKLGDTVAVSKDDDLVRGVVINNLNQKYTCALIDFGVITSVTEVGPLPEKYMNIPEFACLCKADSATVQEISKDTQYNMKIISPSQILVTIEGSEKVVKGSRWNPFETCSLTNKENTVTEKQLPEENSNEKQEEEIYKNVSKSYQLNPSDIVIIISEIEGSLLLRTRECDMTLKKIKQELNNYQGKPLTQQPEVNQLVICPFSDGALYRGKIVSVNGPNVVVEYIDYGNCDSVPIKNLQAINKKLANLPSTCIKIVLKGFAKSKFSLEALTYLEECAARREKFTVIVENDVYDLLFRDKNSLSEKLIALGKPSTPSNAKKPEAVASLPKSPSVAVPSTSTAPLSTPIVSPSTPVAPSSRPITPSKVKLPPKNSPIMLPDIPRCKLNIGDNEVMCLFAGDSADGTVSFCITDSTNVADKMMELSAKVNAYAEKDHTPYHPKQYEVCLAYFEDDWYRAAFIKEVEDGYGMFYIDYGNTKSVTAKHIRKMPEELGKSECLCALCVLEGIKRPIEEPLLSKLVEAIKENKFYNIRVIKEEKNCYVITIPLLYNQWRKEGLLP